MNEFDYPTPAVPADGSVPVTDIEAEEPRVDNPPPVPAPPAPPAPLPVDPVRAAAGRLGGKRVHQLAGLGREYEREHGLKAGRQRLKQLVQLGKRYEVEHGLRTAAPRPIRKGEAWQEFLAALARVVKPVHRPAVERLATALRPGPSATAA